MIDFANTLNVSVIIISMLPGLLFVGCGVSGGEEGARYGPSMMPGGNPKAWPHIRPIFQVRMVYS